jgi:GT2 family glycosyltransferase
VVDDKSGTAAQTANSDMCRRFGIEYHLNTGAKGAAAARNAGMRLCTGTWIIFLDDDVCVAQRWLQNIEHGLRNMPEDAVGMECTVVAEGNGLWDTEVQNLNGGLYLTCHIAYKKEILEMLGGFDEEFRGPFCEDQEFAARALRHGKIVFNPLPAVIHQRKTGNLVAPLRRARGRIRMLLNSEMRFYLKHPESYHRFRHAFTFWGTYRAVALKHAYASLKRRTASQALSHPLQCVVLVLSLLLEQVVAILSFPGVVRSYNSVRNRLQPASKDLQ